MTDERRARRGIGAHDERAGREQRGERQRADDEFRTGVHDRLLWVAGGPRPGERMPSLGRVGKATHIQSAAIGETFAGHLAPDVKRNERAIAVAKPFEAFTW
jgi:hypothetical protein